MTGFRYIENELYCEDVPLKQIANEVGTPYYVYSAGEIRTQYQNFQNAFVKSDRLICFAVKACGNIAVLALLANEGCGADIVSGGELHRALKAGMDHSKIVFAGVGKTRDEIIQAINADILMFNVESRQELELINSCALELDKKARIAFRVNPNIDPGTHPYISTGLKNSKFGIPLETAREEYLYASKLAGLDIVGIHCHIGSQLTSITPFRDAAELVLKLIKQLRKDGIIIRYLDLGGGLGIAYNNETPPSPDEYAAALCDMLKGEDMTLIFEPGRSIVGNAGALVTQVLYTKSGENKSFKIVDAAMNDLARPSLYNSHHGVMAVDETSDVIAADIAGPVCESGDILVRDRTIPDVKQGGLYAVMSAGAYGMTMASNYNSRVRVPEILVDGNKYHIIRRRETYNDLTGPEKVPAYLRTK